MIIVQTPLRASLFGGGTDFRSFFLEEGGCVLSSAIDKYIFVTIKKRFDDKLRVGYTQTEMVDQVSEIEHELIREAFNIIGIDRGVEITTMGDIPAKGSGLGSSSTVTVGALHAMYAFRGKMVTAECLARQACEIEIDRLRKPIGIQDQYIAAYGGFRFMEFTTSGEVLIQKIELDTDQRRRLNENLLLFYTGIARRSDTILGEQKRNIKDRSSVLREMKRLAYIARDEVRAGNVDAIGELLHESWQLKKQLASAISNGGIDKLYDSAIRAGALGGKITGAGGGGFLILYCPHEKQAAVRAALSGLQELPFQLESHGSKVIFDYQR
ncbi:MAG: GHMP kinase [Anaerolineales bacterium]|jgi:D-glycero-alpha-D-manno-heptose-7-phosphate kinase